MRELLKECAERLDALYGVENELSSRIKAELAKPEPPSQESELLEEIEQLKSAINLKERDLIERENAVKSWADALEIERNEHKETKKQLEAELAKPEPPTQQKPLSDDEIKQLWEESLLNTNSFTRKFARAIEQAHGIK